MHISELHILVGLPGSGKTTFANELKKKNERSYNSKQSVYILDCDALSKRYQKIQYGFLNRCIYNTFNGIVILDGLFATQREVEFVLDRALNLGSSKNKCVVDKIVVDYWKRDVDACLWNDIGRRTQNSVATINGLVIERINEKSLSERFNIPVQKVLHYVTRKPKYTLLVSYVQQKGYRVEDDKYLCSRSWSLGGTYHSWTGDAFPISPEEPCDFVELEDTLLEICPSIAYLQVKKVMRDSVTTEDKPNSDYYSDSRDAYYRCNLEELYNSLESMGIDVFGILMGFIS